MSALSDYLSDQILNSVFRGAGYSFPATTYIALCTTTPIKSDTGTTISNGTGTGVEVSGGSYARVAVTSNTSNWTVAGTNDLVSDNAVITFPTATANWGTVVGIAICDAATNGNILFFGNLSVSQTINNGNVASFPVSNLSIQMS